MAVMKFETLAGGEQLPVLGLGTWAIGGRSLPDNSRDPEMIKMIRYAIELGYTHIDTAEAYAAGHTEELVGQAIQDLDRKKLFITTKVSPGHLRYKSVLQALQSSLKRLRTGYVDLYLIHWPNERIALAETFRALNELVEQRLVRYVGVSNFNLRQLQEAQQLSQTPIVTNQVPYNLREREYLRNGVIAYCQQNGILVTGYSPVKGDILRNAVLLQVAQKYQATPAQVAIHWLIRQKKVITIPKSSNQAHLVENLGALDLQLAEEDVDRLNRVG
jgi:diketogulonate reductase-like aldo/keto reductase